MGKNPTPGSRVGARGVGGGQEAVEEREYQPLACICKPGGVGVTEKVVGG
jgi:hypothetical protein